MVEKARTHAGGREMALHTAVGRRTGAHEFKDFLHLDNVTLQSRNFCNRSNFALTVRLTLQLHDKLDGAGDLTADGRDRHRQPCHTDHLLETRDSIAWRISVDSGHGAFVASVHGLQHVEGFFATAFTEN